MGGRAGRWLSPGRGPEKPPPSGSLSNGLTPTHDLVDMSPCSQQATCSIRTVHLPKMLLVLNASSSKTANEIAGVSWLNSLTCSSPKTKTDSKAVPLRWFLIWPHPPSNLHCLGKDNEGAARAVHRVHQGMCVWLHP